MPNGTATAGVRAWRSCPPCHNVPVNWTYSHNCIVVLDLLDGVRTESGFQGVEKGEPPAQGSCLCFAESNSRSEGGGSLSDPSPCPSPPWDGRANEISKGARGAGARPRGWLPARHHTPRPAQPGGLAPVAWAHILVSLALHRAAREGG